MKKNISVRINIDITKTAKILDELIPDIERALSKKINEAADDGVNFAKGRAHIMTGKMKSEIQKKVVSSTEVEIQAPTSYAGYENARGGSKPGAGTHDFFDQTVEYVKEKHVPIFRKTVQDVIDKKKN